VQERVGVIFYSSLPLCTGTWVGPKWVLTRHCLFNDKTKGAKTSDNKYDIKKFSFALHQANA
jgi:hypothetical protein